MSKRIHEMPYGAQVLTSGEVRFRLWAPAARDVELVLVDSAGARSFPMQSAAEGWFELITAQARAGSRYRYRTDHATEVPDPASRSNPQDVHGPSEVIDPRSFEWDDDEWRGRPWHEAIIYELHLGTFSPEGTFAGAEARLEHLQKLGVTVIELMPIADFPGKRGWGYDGVLLFAPESQYGTPAQLKSLIAAAHRRGMAIMLDVVYNHFGPEGNYLGLYAPQFFTERHHTPWGAAINFDDRGNEWVRRFYVNNTLYWLNEYHFDGLRYDAVHAILDDSARHILAEIATAARKGTAGRQIALVLENGDNIARWLGPAGGSDTFDAQWNDDAHHCLHTVLTGETDGYYEDFAEQPLRKLCRSLAEGFVYQGELSRHAGEPRGEPSAHLPPTAFVNFLQNHDQIGNRALGDRIGQIVDPEPLQAALAILLLAPSIPMLFMGEEWNAAQPFPYFCDFEPELAHKVRVGRSKEFARFARFQDPAAQAQIPDPTSPDTLTSACLDWSSVTAPDHERWLEYYRRLIAIRQRDITPRIPQMGPGRCLRLEGGAFAVDWPLHGGPVLHLLANLTAEPAPVVGTAAGRMIFSTHPNIRAAVSTNELAPWSVTWLLEHGGDGG
ncbi:MAG: malto-oligosyltrehalose trehalohydrolase [Sinobacteraceae bacterium]|nr:malto-oligosyltrehalose trehalohydrolase [Nevskiaceae bacterium]